MSSCALKQYVSSLVLSHHTFVIARSTIRSQFYTMSIIST